MNTFTKIAVISKWLILVVLVWTILSQVAPLAQNAKELLWVYGVMLLLVLVVAGLDIADVLYNRGERHRQRGKSLTGDYEHEQKEAHLRDASKYRLWGTVAIAAVLIGVLVLKIVTSFPF